MKVQRSLGWLLKCSKPKLQTLMIPLLDELDTNEQVVDDVDWTQITKSYVVIISVYLWYSEREWFCKLKYSQLYLCCYCSWTRVFLFASVRWLFYFCTCTNYFTCELGWVNVNYPCFICTLVMSCTSYVSQINGNRNYCLRKYSESCYYLRPIDRESS